MNITNMKILRDTIADSDNYFDMRMSFVERHHSVDPKECGSPACVIGWANQLSNEENQSTLAWLSVSNHAYNYVFTGCFSLNTLSKVTRWETLDYLDHCIKLGHIDTEYCK